MTGTFKDEAKSCFPSFFFLFVFVLHLWLNVAAEECLCQCFIEPKLVSVGGSIAYGPLLTRSHTQICDLGPAEGSV